MTAALRHETRNDADLGEAERRAVGQLDGEAYPEGRPHSVLDRSVDWETATLRMLWWEGDRLVCHVGGLARRVTVDGGEAWAGGIASVMTDPHHRGRGLARAAVGAMAAELRRDPRVAFLLLFCRPDLVGFYKELGWHGFTGPVRALQRNQQVDFAVMLPMLQDAARPAPRSGALDLCGRPW